MMPALPGAEHTTRRRTLLEVIGFGLDVLAHKVAVAFISQHKVDKGIEVALEIADVIAPLSGRQRPGIDRFAHMNELPDGVRKLDFSTVVRRCACQRLKDQRAEHVPCRYSQG